MRFLVVAMTDSIHPARWIAQIMDQGWGVRVFGKAYSAYSVLESKIILEG
jgi:hypothetical protein